MREIREADDASPWLTQGLSALKQLARRGICLRPPHPNGRRFLIVHLDGVSRSRLERGVADGTLPNLARLIQRGGHALSPLYAGSPSSTPAFQAGLLWGAKADVPGFLWYDKRLGQTVRMDRTLDATRIEDEFAPGKRGLLEDGTAYFSIFPGGSCVNAFTQTGWSRDVVRLTGGANGWDVLSLCAVHAFTAFSVISGAVSEGAIALADVVAWAAQTGRVNHERAYLKNRILLAAGARRYATTATVLDLVRGVPSIYCCFADYDEISHRRGPDSPQALRALESTDRSLGVVLAALDAVGNDYDLYVLADHGQVATQPFEALTGSTLHDLVVGNADSGWDELATERNQRPGWAANLVLAAWRAATAASAEPGPMQLQLLGAVRDATQEHADPAARAVKVVDAGDVAHVYFTAHREPLDIDEITARFPGVIEAVLRSEGAGVVAVRGGECGVAFHGGKRFDLADSNACEELGLGYGGRRVREALCAMLAMRSAGDIVVYGNGLRGTDVAFAWEFGSHGGISRDEVEAFIIHPVRTPFDFDQVEHASDLYRFFTRHYGLELEPEPRA